MAASCSMAAALADGDLSAEPTAMFSLSQHVNLSLEVERREVAVGVDTTRWETPSEIQTESVSVRLVVHELFRPGGDPIKPFINHSGLLQEGAVVLGEVRFAYGPFFRPSAGMVFSRLGPPAQEPSYLQVKICLLF